VSGINVGLFCSTPAVALSRNIHRKHAMQMLLTGNLISSNEALSYGLVNKVVRLTDLESETNKLATSIAVKSSGAVRLGKKMFYEQLQMDVESAYEHATERIVCNMEYEDTKRGIDAFLAKSTTNKKSGA
jgi:enoyl-CoA hydratase/carnithine racemase